VDKHTHVLLSL